MSYDDGTPRDEDREEERAWNEYLDRQVEANRRYEKWCREEQLDPGDRVSMVRYEQSMDWEEGQ